MKSPGHFIAFPTELSSGVESCHNSFKSRYLCLFMHINRNTSAIVYHTYAVTRKKRNLNIISKTTHGFVAGVVKNFCYKMVKTVWPRCANVHSRALSNRLKSFEDRD